MLSVKDFFYDIVLEYKVNTDNAAKFYKLIPKEKEELNLKMKDQLIPSDPWYKFDIFGQTYIAGYMKKDSQFVFLNLSDTLDREDLTANFEELGKISGKGVILFLNTIAAIMKRMVEKDGVDNFRIMHHNANRMKLYSKFLTHAIASFLPEFRMLDFGTFIAIYKPLTESQKLRIDMKGKWLINLVEKFERENAELFK